MSDPSISTAYVANASDERQVNFGRRKARRREELNLAAMRAVLSTPAGRQVFARVLEYTGLWESSFSEDLATMAFKEGRRAVGLRLREDMRAAAPALFDTLEAEQRAMLEADRREAQAITTATKEE